MRLTNPQKDNMQQHTTNDKQMISKCCVSVCGKVSPILGTFTSRNDSDFESLIVSLKESKPDGVYPNFNDIDYYVQKNEGKFYGFRQTVLLGEKFESFDRGLTKNKDKIIIYY